MNLTIINFSSPKFAESFLNLIPQKIIFQNVSEKYGKSNLYFRNNLTHYEVDYDINQVMDLSYYFVN